MERERIKYLGELKYNNCYNFGKYDIVATASRIVYDNEQKSGDDSARGVRGGGPWV